MARIVVVMRPSLSRRPAEEYGVIANIAGVIAGRS
jgi:hypothetical protein